MKVEVLLLNFTKKNSTRFKEYLSKELYKVKSESYSDYISLNDYKANVILIDNTNRNNLINFKSLFNFKNDRFLRNTPILLYGEIDEIDKKFLSYFDDILEISSDAHLLKAKIFSMIKYYLQISNTKLNHKFENVNFKEVERMDDCRVLIISEDTKVPYEISGFIMEKVMSIEYAIFENKYETFFRDYKFSFDLIIIDETDSIHRLVFLYSQIKSHQDLKDAHILFVKNPNDLIFLADVINLGVNNYVHYPLDKKEFLFQLAVQLRNKKYLSVLQENVVKQANSSWIDELTGLYNKKYLAYYFEHLNKLSTSKAFSVIMVDIDNFKAINDTGGHIVGDEVLQEISALLKEEAKNNIVVRFGGDEFLIMVANDISKKNITTTLEKKVSKIILKIEDAVKKRLFSSAKLKVYITLGFSTALNNESILEIVNSADKKMYKEKFRKKEVDFFI